MARKVSVTRGGRHSRGLPSHADNAGLLASDGAERPIIDPALGDDLRAGAMPAASHKPRHAKMEQKGREQIASDGVLDGHAQSAREADLSTAAVEVAYREPAGSGPPDPVDSKRPAPSGVHDAGHSGGGHAMMIMAGIGLAGGIAAAASGGGGGKADGVNGTPKDVLAPTVASVEITSANGAQNGRLGIGDVIIATITFTESVTVSGAPQLALTIGGTTVQAGYSGGSGTSRLTFAYTIQGGQNDADGIAIPANLLALNGGSIADQAGNVAALAYQAVSDNAGYLVDTTVALPVLRQASDTGASQSDGVTSNGVIDVTLASDVASWRYSIDGGVHWTTGAGTSFTLAEGAYAAGEIKVEQTDLAGNVSLKTTNSIMFVIDQTIAAPTIALASVTGTSNSEQITNTAALTLSGAASDVTRTYTINGGSAVSAYDAGNLPDGRYTVVVTDTDTAGNTRSASVSFVLDATLAPPSFILHDDTGAVPDDGITSNGVVDVTLASDVVSWRFSADGGAHWATGVGTSFALAEGTYAAGEIKVEQTDIAGNVSAPAVNSANLIIDQTAPIISLQEAHSGPRTIVLAYDTALDPLNPPRPGNFAVNTGVANPVESVSVSGSTVTLHLANGFDAGLVNVAYTLPDKNAGAIQDVAGNRAMAFSTGIAADGYVRGASVYVDSNGNGVAEPGEYIGRTDDNGNFFLPVDGPAGSLIVLGGVNIDTGVPNTVALRAPQGSLVVNPLTTLIQTLVANSKGATSSADAMTAIANAFDLTLPAGKDLTNFDPLSSGAGGIDAQKAAVQIATIVTMAQAGAPVGESAANTGEAALASLANEVAQASAAQQTVNLTNPDTVRTALGSSTVDLATVVTATTEISATSTFAGIALAQATALDAIDPAAPTSLLLQPASDTGASATDGITRITSPVVRVALETQSLDGTAVVAGDRVVVSANGGDRATVTLTAQDIAQKAVGVVLPNLSDGNWEISARLYDKAQNVGPSSAPITFTIDTTAPLAPLVNVIAGDNTINIAEQSAILSGTVEAGATVTIEFGHISRTVTADAISGAWSYALQTEDISELGQGPAAFTISATDRAGNVSPATTAVATIDTIAPMQPVIGVVASDDVINGLERSALIAGSSENGARLILTLGAATRIVVADAQTGAWSYPLQPADLVALGEGAATITATAIDAAGNSSSAVSRAIAVDTVAPGLPTLAIVAGDNVVNAAEQGATLTGTAEAGATVTVRLDSVSHDVTANVASGVWAYTLAPDDITALGQGGVSIVVSQTDIAGNVSGLATRNVFVDTRLSAAAGRIDVVYDNVPPSPGPLASGDKTNDNTLALSGTLTAQLAADEALVVYDGATRLGVASVTPTSWSFSAPVLVNGTHSLSVRVEDAAGNQGTPSSVFTVSVNAVVPSATAQIVSVADVNSPEKTELQYGAVTNHSNLLLAGTLTGTLDAGDTVQVYDGLVKLGIANVTLNTWTYATGALSDGSHAFAAVIEASDANQGIASSDYAVKIDTLAPDAPILPTIAADNVINADEVATVLSGSAEAGATVALTLGNNTRLIAADEITGSWSYTLRPEDIAALGQGGTTVSAIVTDAAGNTSTAASRAIVIDTAAPGLAVFDAIAGDDTISNSETGATISGSSEPGATVVLSLGDMMRTVPADAVTGAWHYTLQPGDVLAMGQGSRVIGATVIDPAGNSGSAAFRQVFVDTQPPSAPAFATVAGNNVINAAEVAAEIRGIAEAGAVITLSLGNISRNTSADAVSGVWSYTLQPADIVAMGQGSSFIVATATDAAGNVSASATRPVTIDTRAPAAPSMAIVAGDDVINASEQATVLRGTAEVGSTVSLSLDGSVRALSADAVTGEWSYALQSSDLTVLGQGNKTFTVTAVDAAGNSSTSLTRAVSIDTRAPNIPLITPVAGDNVITTSEMASTTITGSAEPGATIDLSFGALVRTVTADVVTGAWTYALNVTDLAALGQGARTITATATDAVGNTSFTASRAVTVDTVIPPTPTLALSQDTGVSATDGITRIGTVNVDGLQVGAIWQWSPDGGAQWTDGSGSAFTISGDGAKTAVVRVLDTGGNTVVTSAGLALTLDTTAPIAPVPILRGDTGMAGLLTSVELSAGVTLELLSIEPNAVATIHVVKETADGGVAGETSFAVTSAKPSIVVDAGSGYFHATITQQDLAGNVSPTFATRPVLLADLLDASGAFTMIDGAYVGTAGNDAAVGDASSDEIILAGGGNDEFFNLQSGDVFIGMAGSDTVHVDRSAIEVADTSGPGYHYEIGVYAQPELLGSQVAAAVHPADGPVLALGGNQAFVQGETIVIRGGDGTLLHVFTMVDDGLGHFVLHLDDAANRVVLGTGDDRVDGAGGNDLIVGLSGNDWISGGDGNDILAAGLPLNPSASADHSTLLGGAGDDSLVGFSGVVEMTGGAGNDVFAVAGPTSGVAIIAKDFSAGEDKVDLSQLLSFYGGAPADAASQAAWLAAHATENADGNAVIAAGANATIEMVGVHLAALTAADIIWTGQPSWAIVSAVL